MECLYEYMDYLEKRRLRPADTHAAILNTHILHDAANANAVC